MYRKEAKEYIIEHPEIYLKLDNVSEYGNGGNPSYICPICGSGTGKNGTGITTMDGKHFFCWANHCIWNNDVLDIIGKVYGISRYNDKLQKACEIYDIDYNALECDPGYSKTNKKANSAPHDEPLHFEKNMREVKNKENTNRIDFLNFYKSCIEHRRETDYLVNRGISYETQDRFWIGYFPFWRSHTAIARGKNPPMSPRVIIPTSRYSYVARDTRPYATAYTKIKEGQSEIFNYKALKHLTSPVFITEGEIDALSILELGYTAVGLGSTSNIDLLVNHLKANRPIKPVLIALDKDKLGWDAAEKLQARLKKLEIEYYCLISEINGEYKDPNERLIADRDGLRKALDEAVRRYD